jgi:oxygen-dependent protoporphyrinogen oxidase
MAMIGASFCHVKYPGRAPDRKALIRAFVGGSLNPWAYDMDDADVERRVIRELDQLIGVKGKPLFATIHRWPKSMAQFRVGHLDRVKQTDDALAAYPPVAVAGNAFAGGGVPDCIHRGEWAAEYVVGRITGNGNQPASTAGNAQGQPH